MEWIVVAGLSAILLVSPIFFGSVTIWARGVFFVAAAAMLALWLSRAAWAGHLYLARTGLWLLGALCLALAIFQTIPLEMATLKWLSPATARIYQQTLSYQGEVGKGTLSVSAAATRSELYRLGIMIMVFALTINTVRTRNRLVAVVVVLLGLGSFQALYAFLNQFRGAHTPLMGTFHSKNQFAALLAMIVPLSLAMVAGIGKDNPASGSRRYRIVHWLSSKSFAQQILLAAAAALMGLAALFSMSRAALFTMLAGITVFGCYLLIKSSLRRYSVPVFVIVCLFVGLGSWMGMSKVIKGVKDVTSLQAISWQGRLELMRSGKQMLADYPLFGAGLATTPLAVGRYQSLIEGNYTAFSLHNDWLQAACENGLIGAGLILAMLGIFLANVLRRIRHCPDRLCKLLSIAALVGAGTMALHSFADRNLSKVTSNGIVFATLLALAYAGAHLANAHRDAPPTKPGHWRLSLGPWPIRVALLVVAVVGLAWLCVQPIKAGLADVSFNSYLMASPVYPNVCQSYPQSRQLRRDEYFWLAHSGPTEDESWATQQLAEARKLAPDNARYLREQAMGLVENIDRIVDEQAQLRARSLLGEHAQQASKVQYNQTVWAMAAITRSNLYRQTEYKEQMGQSCRLLQQAIALAPSKPAYHLDLAMVLARLDKVWTQPQDNPIDPNVRPLETAKQETRIALWLAPHKPAILLGAGCMALDQASSANTDLEKEALLENAVLQFRRAMFGNPDWRLRYPQRIYQLLEMSQQPGRMLKATPQTVPAAAELAQHLLDTSRWQQVLEVLDILEEIADSPAKPLPLANFNSDRDPGDNDGDLAWQSRAGTPNEYTPQGARPHLSKWALRMAISGKCQALGHLGYWTQRYEQIKRYQQLLRDDSDPLLDQADTQAAKGYYQAAMAQYLKVLQQDWSNPRALIGAVEIADMPGIPANLRRWNSPLEQLYRLVIHNDRLTKQQCQRTQAILSQIHPKKQDLQLEVDFIRAAASCLANDHERTVEILSALVKTDQNIAHNWEQEHLIWYFLAKANEELGRKDAIAQYKRALEIVPTHGPSLTALQRLGDTQAQALLAKLKPANECNINFAGKVRLLGYSLYPDQDGSWLVQYFWQFQDRVMADCLMEIRFCDGRGDRVFTDGHVIRQSHGPYWLEIARWGEIVVEQRKLKGDPNLCPGIRLAFRIDRPPVGVSNYLPNQLGQFETYVGCLTQSRISSGNQAQNAEQFGEMPESSIVSN